MSRKLQLTANGNNTGYQCRHIDNNNNQDSQSQLRKQLFHFPFIGGYQIEPHVYRYYPFSKQIGKYQLKGTQKQNRKQSP